MTTLTNMPDAEYHARAELSSTEARILLESPAKYRWQKDHPRTTKSDAFDLGTATHSKVLGTGAGITVYPDEHLTPSGAVSTKAATVEWQAEQRAKGLVPVAPHHATMVDRMAEAVLAHPVARGILENVSGREVSIITEVDGVPVRARFDIYDGHRAADLKTSRDASPRGFNQAVARYGYHVQEQWYTDAHTAETGSPLDRFEFIVVEASAPYLVAVYDLDFMWEEIAKEKAKRARETYLECTRSGFWPGYPSLTLTPPTWAVYETSEEEIQV